MATLYFDAQNGNDANDGTLGTPKKKHTTFVANAAAGDTAILRCGLGALYSEANVTLVHSATGTIDAPIKVEVDFDDAFGDHVDLSATGTATLTVGSKIATFTSNMTSVVSVKDALFEENDDPREYLNVVKTISGDGLTVTFYQPYRGQNAGSGKSVTNMQSFPKFGVAGGSNRNLDFSTSKYWEYNGFDLATNNVESVKGTGSGIVLKNFYITCGASTTTKAVSLPSPIIRNLVTTTAINEAVACTGLVDIKYSLLDCRATTGKGLSKQASSKIVAEEVVVESGGIGASLKADGDDILINCDFSAATIPEEITAGDIGSVGIQDHEQNQGISKFINKASASSANPIVYHMESDTSVVRPGGSLFSLLVKPSDNINTSEHGRLTLLEVPIRFSDVEVSHDIYFKTEDTALWTANPTADELFVEVEYWGHTTNPQRIKAETTGTLNFTGSTDWQALTINVDAPEAGVGTLRVFYGKGKESGKSNEFRVDPKVDFTEV